MIERPDADTLLAGPLGSWLSGQSSERAEARVQAQFRFLLAVGAAAAVAFAAILYSGEIVIALQLGGAIGIGGYAWSEWAKRPVVNRIKDGINGAIAQALGLSYALTVRDESDFERARAFALVPSFDNRKLEDEWAGEVGGRPFHLHEAKLTEERGSGKSRRTVTVFTGVIMAVGFARDFTGTTLIARKGSHKRFFGLIGEDKETISPNGVQLQQIDMVDPRFADSFSVWSNDPVEGHYLIDPLYVEKLVAIEQAFAGDKIRALFAGGQLLIVLEGGNLFESGSLDAGEDRRLLEQSIAQFGTLADMAIQLNARGR
jgi:hypothetical protein